MYDSDGKSSADIAVSVTQTQKTVEVTYTPSADWLNAAERVYPVTIDPETQSGTASSTISPTNHITKFDEIALRNKWRILQ